MIHILLIITFAISALLGCEREITGENPGNDSKKEAHHPFLITSKDEFNSLRGKASQEPWKSMKKDAIARSLAGSSNDAYKLQEYIGAAALAYILDTGNEKIHAERVRDAIVNKYSTLDIGESSDWGKVVRPMGAFFSAILALDIVYDSLSVKDIEACEDVIESQIFKVNREGSWKTVRYGTHGTWDIYKGNRKTPDDKYFEATLHQITPDGVSPVTNHYAWERVGGGNSRVSKSGYMDVLEYTGIDNRYYTNERIQKFQRWLFGSSINCNKEMAIFGDMLPTQGIGNYMLLRRVVNFDLEAAGYASWFLEGKDAIGHILTYILPAKELPEPVVPSSKIYENGGAFFRDQEDDPDGMQAVLYNIKSQDEWHTHNEVNGLALSGLGNRLLVNGGRLGEPTRPAYLNNTLTINGENHQTRVGGGIVEGFTCEGLDFAIGDDGSALNNSIHLRNLILVQTMDGIPGYFVVYDEIAAIQGDKVKNYLHPANQTVVSEEIENTLFTANIDHYPTVSGTRVHFYYLTPPDKVNIEKSQSAVPDRYPGYPEHNRLESVYQVDTEGKKDLTTIILPSKANGPKINFQKLEGVNYTACAIQQKGNINDYIFESSAEKLIENKDFSYQGELLFVRMSGKKVRSCFIKNGSSFQADDLSMESDHPITMYLRENKGAIISEGAKIRLTGAGVNNIQFNPEVTVLDSGNDFIEMQVSEGIYYLE